MKNWLCAKVVLVILLSTSPASACQESLDEVGLAGFFILASAVSLSGCNSPSSCGPDGCPAPGYCGPDADPEVKNDPHRRCNNPNCTIHNH